MTACTCDARFSGNDEAEYKARGCPNCVCTSTPPKAREFWIADEYENVAGAYSTEAEALKQAWCNDPENVTHVIEYSRVAELEKELSALRLSAESLAFDISQQSEKEITALESENLALLNQATVRTLRILELESSLKEQCEINAISAERELKLQTENAKLREELEFIKKCTVSFEGGGI